MSNLARNKNHQTFEVEVNFLEEDRTQIFYVPINATGKWLLDEICKLEEIEIEKEYFGLRYIKQDQNVAAKTWIDNTKSINLQLKFAYPKVVSLRVKHYPENPLLDLSLPKSQYLLYHQIKRDLKNGRLIGKQDHLIMIAALITQVELGDYSIVSQNSDDYLENHKILHNQHENIREKIMKKHKSLETLLPSEAANTVLQYACELDTYGVDPIKVKAKAFENHRCFIGVNHKGVLEFLSSNLNSIHQWNDISKMYCDKKKFIISVKKHDSNNKRKVTRDYEYKCNNSLTADSLWCWTEDSKIFFTADKSDRVKPIKSKRGLFSRSRTFTFSGRTRNELLSKYSDSNLPSNEMIVLMNQFGSQKHLNLISSDSLPRSVDKGVKNRSKITNLLENQKDLYVDNQIDVKNTESDSEKISIFSKEISPDNNLKYSTLPNMAKSGLKADIYASTNSKGQPKQLQHWQMASFFDLSKRKFLPEAEARQNKLIKVTEKMRMANGEEITITSEEDDQFTSSEALNVDAALGELNQIITEASTKQKGWFSKMIGSIKEKVFGFSSPQEKEKTPEPFKMTSYQAKQENQLSKKVDGSLVNKWFFTTSLILAISVLGFIVIVEKDVNSIRSLTMFKSVESTIYAPLRNLIFSKTS